MCCHEDIEDLKTIEDMPEKKKSFKFVEYKKKKNQSKKAVVDQWVEYIGGKRHKKPIKHYADTLISASRSEKCANKPLVYGTCANVEVKF